MKTLKLFIGTLLLFFGHCHYAAAQQKGSFSTFIRFMNDDRSLSCFVPNDYDSTQSYRLMIALHGAGDNSTNYRNALMNSLGWQNLFANTIFICPDGGEDYASSFNTPAGDDGIVEAAIRFAIDQYNIDSNDILLQGFSLGGRSALKYGLEHTSRFKALLLNTPAVQDMADAYNYPRASIMYDYSKAPLIPIYMTCGALDDSYTEITSRVAVILKEHNAKFEYNIVPGIGHTIPSGAVTNAAIAFLQNPKRADFDVDIFKIEAKERYCGAVSATCRIRNTGVATVNSVKLNIQCGTVSTTHTWTGNLGLFEQAVITLPAITTADGTDSLKITVAEINTSQTDPFTTNNSIAKEIQIASQTTLTSINEGFEGGIDYPLWIFEENGSIFDWSIDSTVSKSGQQSVTNLNTALSFNTTGLESKFSTPALNFGMSAAPTLSFYVAFNYHKYTPPYFTKDTIFADTLEVLMTTDCGETYQRLYKKGGAELATVSEPILNPLTVGEIVFDPVQSEWRQEIIDLSNFNGVQNATVMFKYISGYGGNIYIDNIRIGEGIPAGVNDAKQDLAFSMYPNPANDKLSIALNNARDAKVTIYDNLGKAVLSESGNHTSGARLDLDISYLSNGFYVVETSAGSQKATQKLIISR